MVRHVPVLVAEALEFLGLERGGVFVDCTLGLGGHAEAMLRAGSGVRVVGIDRDPEARELAAERLAPWGDRVRFVAGEFDRLEELLEEQGIGRVQGILADLGVSSLQLESAARGFSFRLDGPLDMRMGPSELTAREVVNTYAEADLEKIFREYGEEKQARRIARAVVDRRAQKPVETTGELQKLVARAKGPRRSRRIDPATRVFQSLRIEVNRELAGLDVLLDQAIRMLDADGRLVVISYHSLEDRIVKHRLRELARGEIDAVTGQTVAESRLIDLLTKRPVRPSEREVAANPRARSARLRAARRI